VLRKKIKGSLTLRIFLITSLILLAACAVTYGFIVLATPITYSSIVTTEFQNRSQDLAAELEQMKFEESGEFLDNFIRESGGTVMITGEDGRIIQTPSKLAISAIYEDDTTVIAISPRGDTQVSITKDSPLTQMIDQFGSMVGNMTDDGSQAISASNLNWYFKFADIDEVYCLYVTPPVEQFNQTLQALGQVAPWLLVIMLLFSLLCALFYSRYITKPIVQLSGISQCMADLDFSWKCGETRTDEIGVLGRNLNEMSQRLSTALTELEDANAALQQDIDRERELERQRLAFFSAASHELKTPVTILKGQLTGMLEGIDIYQDRDKYLAKSLQVTSRMESLVQEILTVSRMETCGLELNRRQIDLTELVRQQITFYDDLVLQKGLRTELRLAPHAPFSGDPALIQKVLDNVLSNAVFYAQEGAKLSISVTAGGEAGPILTVENSGSHIPEDALPHVFEAFYRADASRSRRTGGSGLGLYIVKMILDRHGARYGIENTTDGVRFVVSFA